MPPVSYTSCGRDARDAGVDVAEWERVRAKGVRERAFVRLMILNYLHEQLTSVVREITRDHEKKRLFKVSRD